MTIEEIIKVWDFLNDNKKKVLKVLIPELKEESEDERLRKELTEFLKRASGGFLDATTQCKTFGKWLAWLEKQGHIDNLKNNRHKWSEEDSIRLQRIIDFLWKNRKGDTDTIFQQEQDIAWLKSLKQRLK